VPALLAGVVFLWTPAHFWSLALARRGDYDRARVPMLPSVVGARSTSRWVVIHLLATVAVSLWVGVAASRGLLYFAVAGGAGLIFGAAGLALIRQPDAATGYRLFKLSGPYLGLVFLGLFLDALIGASSR
jgi:protoheme IX farnesyltransferase